MMEVIIRFSEKLRYLQQDKRDDTILSHEYDIFGKTLAVHESRDKVADASSKALRYEYDIVDRLTKT
ncbi:MAG: hypothetical protein LBB42_02685, partial [Coriobacteriales bacterium]|nr:hypothetical protein [Coriobacteriales bacterium]